ncbi:MAG: Eco57I restriction-modification methylase domain-containing protein [Candidatus Aenigmatarchaeota archaeon]
MGKGDALSEISRLVQKYDRIVSENKLRSYNEEMTKKGLIEPLFCALGWSISDGDEVTVEETISKKRVDYGFRIGGVPKFFLEAKSLKESLDKVGYIEQAITYAYHKGCTWAVLTNFKEVRIFNAEVKAANALQSHFITLHAPEFAERFDDLWLLSKEGFSEGLLDKKAEKWGKMARKAPLDKQLLADFTHFRQLLSKNATKLNASLKISEDELDEAVQRLLDRLIFIRNCEDRGMGEKKLVYALRDWETRGKGRLIESLRSVFAYFDEQYNSKIFAPHLCDQLDIDNSVLEEIINGLYYTKDKSVSYDFSAIEADVLGNIYEQYLGHILKKTAKRAKVEEAHRKRKEQGIYYTPTYIVDYIVKNTVGEFLKSKNSRQIEKMRILDPACGSGSFLIKAFDMMNKCAPKKRKGEGQAKLDLTESGSPLYSKKVKILENNILGVDLDKQAVEIAQLNLLLKIAEKGHRLPTLQKNIQNGNSLIDDEKIAGDKAFKWEERFKEVMDEGGFDVIIGNPPYVRIQTLDNKQIDFFNKQYESATKN